MDLFFVVVLIHPFLIQYFYLINTYTGMKDIKAVFDIGNDVIK